MPLQTQVHEYVDDAEAPGGRRLVRVTPWLRLGRSDPSGYSGEAVFLQSGQVWGQEGAALMLDEVPAWVPEALGGLTPQALEGVGFTPDVVAQYTGAVWEETPAEARALPPGIAEGRWMLGQLCPVGHDYGGLGLSRYGKQGRCVDCENTRKHGTRAVSEDEDVGTS